MNKLKKQDKLRLEGFLRSRDFDAAKTLIREHYSKKNKSLINRLERATTTNIGELSTIDERRTEPHFILKFSKLTFIVVGILGIGLGILIGYYVYTEEELFMPPLIFSILFTVLGLYILIHVTISNTVLEINSTGIYYKQFPRKSINWNKVLDAFLFVNVESQYDVKIILIYTKDSVKPITFNITFTENKLDELASVINHYLKNEN